MTRRMIDSADLRRGDALLDIGCGRGESLALLRAEYGFICRGIEPDAANFAAARQNAAGCDIRQAAAEHIPFGDGAFRCALAECSFSLFRDPLMALTEISRVLTADGILLLSDVYAKKGDGCRGEGLLRQVYPMATICQMLEDAGFVVEATEDAGDMLKSMLGQLILDHGREEAYRRVGLDRCAAAIAGVGYFYLRGRKGRKV